MLIIFISVAITYFLFPFSSTKQKKDVAVIKTSKSMSQPHIEAPSALPESIENLVPIHEETNIEEVLPIEQNITYPTIREIEEKTEQIYSELTPESYDETVEEANAVFENLDVVVEEIDEKTYEEMEEVAQNEEIEQGSSIEENIQEVSEKDSIDEIPVIEE